MDELIFLRAEVSKLERFIEASAESRAALARQAQQLQRNARVCHECLETALVEVGSSLAWEALRADPPDLGQLGRAALLEMRGLAVDTGVLRSEMALVESERNAAREVEAYALSVARSYRGFASQGAARLDEVCVASPCTSLCTSLSTSLCRSAPALRTFPHCAPCPPPHPSSAAGQGAAAHRARPDAAAARRRARRCAARSAPPRTALADRAAVRPGWPQPQP